MKQRPFQPGRWCRRLLYTVSLTLLLSGVGFAWIQHLDQAGRAGDMLVQLKPRLLALHGISAMSFVLLLGTLLVSHIQRAWLGRKNRPNGALFLGAVGLLTLSGYSLYYLGTESLRDADGQFHLWLGVVTPALLWWHIWCGRKAVNPQKASHSMRAHAKPIALGLIQKIPANGEVPATSLKVLEREAL